MMDWYHPSAVHLSQGFQITFLPLQHSRHVCIWTQTLKNPHTTYTHTPSPNFKSMANLIPEHPPYDSFLSSPCIMNRDWNEAIQSRPNTDQVLWIIDVLLTMNWAVVFFFYTERAVQPHECFLLLLGPRTPAGTQSSQRRFWLHLIWTDWSGALTL